MSVFVLVGIMISALALILSYCICLGRLGLRLGSLSNFQNYVIGGAIGHFVLFISLLLSFNHDSNPLSLSMLN